MGTGGAAAAFILWWHRLTPLENNCALLIIFACKLVGHVWGWPPRHFPKRFDCHGKHAKLANGGRGRAHRCDELEPRQDYRLLGLFSFEPAGCGSRRALIPSVG